MCCLLPEYVYGELVFFLCSPPHPLNTRYLWYCVLCSSFTIYCWERTRVGWAGDAPIGLSTKEVSERMEPSSLDPLCREGRQATSWNALASIATLHSSFLSPEDGIFFLMWTYLQSYASLPTKPARPQCQRVLTTWPPPNWGRNPLTSSLLIFLSASCFCSCSAQAPGSPSLLKKLQKCACRTRSVTILMYSESHANTIWVREVLVRETVSVKIADILIWKDRWTTLGWKV